MKRLFTSLFIICISIQLSAQVIDVNISQNTTTDTVIAQLQGVISGPLPPYNSHAVDITEGMQEMEIPSIRNNDYYNDALDMEGMFNCGGSTYPSWNGDPDDENNYNWGASDTLFESIINGGFEPFFRIGGEYECQIRHHDYKGPRPYEEDNYIRAAKRVVNRYLHWNDSPGTFTYLDLWTEYPNTTFWDRTNAEFEVFWGKLFDTLKTAYPQLKIGGPGYLFTLFIAKGRTDHPRVQEMISFLNYLYEHNIHPDWIGWHLFHLEPADYYKAGVNMRHLLKGDDLFSFVPWAGSGFFDNTELICDAYYLSKVKVDSLGENPRPLPRSILYKYFNRKEGAALLSGIWMNLQLTDTKRAYYYRVNDPSSDPNLPPTDTSNGFMSGLFWGDTLGTPKTTAYAFKFFSYIYNNYPYLLTTDDFTNLGISDSLWVLASEDKAGKYAVLVSNVDSDNYSVFKLHLNGVLVDTSNFIINVRKINDSENGETIHPHTRTNFRINSMNVMLIELEEKPVAVEENEVPLKFSLEQNYPNPFNPTTTISYVIARSEATRQSFGSSANANNSTDCRAPLRSARNDSEINVSLKVYDILGREVATLVNKKQSPGKYSVQFNASNLPSGIYFYTLRAGSFVQTRKMILMK